MKRTVIGLVGPMVSGKGEVGKHLQELGFTYESLSDRVREEADTRGIERSRENLQDLGNNLRDAFGPGVLAERTVELLENTVGNIVIDGIRNPGEIEFLRRALGVTILSVDAPVESRLEWYLARAESRGEDTATAEDFLRANARDFGQGEEDSGQQVGRCLELADIRIRNEGSRKQLFEDVEYHLILDLGFSPEGARKAQERK